MVSQLKTLIDWHCPICKSSSYDRIDKHYTRAQLFKKSKLITCTVCLAKSVYPMPSESELEKFNQSYWEDVQTASEKDREFHYVQSLYRVKYLKSHLENVENMKILDIGAGGGYIYDVLKANNDNVNFSAVEADLNMQEELRKKGVKNVYLTWQAIHETDFDMITLSHVIEHFAEPLKYLKEIKKLLKRNGYIFVEVPNQDDFFKTFFGAHLIFFNEVALKRLFEELEMRIIDIVTVGENIENINKSKVKKFVKRKFPPAAKLAEFYGKKTSEVKTSEKDFVKAYRLDEFNNNGRWLRIIAQDFLISNVEN